MNTYRFLNLAVGLLLMLQVILFSKTSPIISGFLLGLGASIIIVSEIIVPMAIRLGGKT